MSLHTEIKGGIKEAMKAKDPVRLSVLRGLSAAFVNELVAMKRMPTDELGDEEAINVIRRQVKQRKDSIEQFTKGARQDLADNEKAELAVLETFLPVQMPRDEVKKVAETKKTEMGIIDKTGAGKLIGAVMKELKGKAYGDVVKSVVDELLA